MTERRLIYSGPYLSQSVGLLPPVCVKLYTDIIVIIIIPVMAVIQHVLFDVLVFIPFFFLLSLMPYKCFVFYIYFDRCSVYFVMFFGCISRERFQGGLFISDSLPPWFFLHLPFLITAVHLFCGFLDLEAGGGGCSVVFCKRARLLIDTRTGFSTPFPRVLCLVSRLSFGAFSPVFGLSLLNTPFFHS